MPVRIKTLPGGEFRGEQSATAEMNKSQRSKIANAMKKAAKAAAPSGTRISDQDIMNALKALNTGKQKNVKRGMMGGGKVMPKKKMMHGGKVKKK